MLAQAFSLSLTAFAGVFLSWFAITGNAIDAARGGMLLASLALFLDAGIQAKLNYDLASARVARARMPLWASQPVIDQPAPPSLENQPNQPVQTEERIRLMPVVTSAHTTFASDTGPSRVDGIRPMEVTHRTVIDGVDERDLTEFIEQLPIRRHSKHRWEGYHFKSGRVCDPAYYELLIAILCTMGAIVDRVERKTGKLVLAPDDIKRRLQLA